MGLPKQRQHRIVIQLPVAGDLVRQAELFPQELREIRYHWCLLAGVYLMRLPLHDPLLLH